MFYLKPPRGMIQRERLLDLAAKRLTILAQVEESQSYEDLLEKHLEESGAIAESSSKDRVSHFILALAAENHPTLRSFLLRSEPALFGLRWAQLDGEGKKSALLELQRHLRELLSERVWRQDRELSSLLDVISEAVDGGLFVEQTVSLNVPFTLAPELVRTRRAPLNDGFLRVTNEEADDFVMGAFHFIQRRNLSRAIGDMPVELEDLPEMVNSYFKRMRPPRGPADSSESLSANEVSDRSEAFFPPCMKLAQRRLERERRLPHAARIAYTLFLKDAGMSLTESISFWSHFYCRPLSGSSSCCHDWSREERRYRYNIEHLYGRRGAMKNYSSQSCQSVADAGVLVCPFADRLSDVEDLHKELERVLGRGDLDREVAEKASAGDARGACAKFSNLESSSHCLKPLHFYGALRENK